MTKDEKFMVQALALAKKGRGGVEPNPMVGALVVRGGEVVGRGYHTRYGGPHAEVTALRRAGRRARGGSLYVTLEPCSVQGKTPPCAEAILKSGINEVVISAADPNPDNRGKSPVILREAGLRVRKGILQKKGNELIRPFVNFIKGDLPFLVVKWAMSLDGRIATRTGDASWISCEKSRKRGHGERARCEAVLTGIGTVLTDDPLLTCRYGVKGNPVRVVVDSRLRIPVSSRIVQTAGKTPTCIATSRAKKNAGKIRLLKDAGCEILFLPKGKGGVNLLSLFRQLRKQGLYRILVEAGSRLNGSLFSLALVDKVLVFMAPKIIGGEKAPGPVGGAGEDSMADVPFVEETARSRVGRDFYFEGILKNPKAYVLAEIK